MLCLKVPLKDAEKAKKRLCSSQRFDTRYFAAKDKSFIYFPVTEKFNLADPEHKFVQRLLKKKEEHGNLKQSLGKKLDEKELKVLKRSVDVIGSIAIVEIPNELKKKEKLIAKEVMKTNKSVKTVLRKGKHEGVFRVQKLAYLAGEKTKETVHRENNVSLKLDVEKVYFSPRLSNDRKRICRLIKKPERVLVMFSGCGPYVCAIAKNTPSALVDGVEINPVGHEYARQNVLLNKLDQANVFLGDVREAVPGLGKNYDRILMPLPKSAAEYLDVALAVSKKGTVIHFYDFQLEGEFDKSVEKIHEACKAAGKQCRVLDIARCGQNAPRQFRICVDFEVI